MYVHISTDISNNKTKCQFLMEIIEICDKM